MKRKIEIDIKEEPSAKVRRRARAVAGAPPPSRPIQPKTAKPPKHKKKQDDLQREE